MELATGVSPIAVHRFARGWTQDDLAAAAGITRVTVSNVERGKTKRPHPLTAKAIAEALGVDADVLFEPGIIP